MKIPSYDDFYELENRLDKIEEKLDNLIDLLLGEQGFKFVIYRKRTKEPLASFDNLVSAEMFIENCKTKSERGFYKKSLLGVCSNVYDIEIKKKLSSWKSENWVPHNPKDEL